MKAIETTYRGIRYRSRTEARWAVFFEKLGIEAVHEGEGYDLDGMRYLCDFWLPAPKIWFEVKGIYPNDFEAEKARRLAKASGHMVLIGFGHPPTDEESPCIRTFGGRGEDEAWLGDYGRANIFVVGGGYRIIATLKGSAADMGGTPECRSIMAAARAAQAERFGI